MPETIDNETGEVEIRPMNMTEFKDWFSKYDPETWERVKLMSIEGGIREICKVHDVTIPKDGQLINKALGGIYQEIKEKEN